MKIIGAGLAGLICGSLNAQSTIYERNQSDFVEHKAVLRFRDEKIARALGLSFRKVTVRKAIWCWGEEVLPSPRFANWYSTKVRGIVTENSLWNMAPSERYIAPEDLHAILAEICGKRVHWGHAVGPTVLAELLEGGEVVSTMPIVQLLITLGIPEPFPFKYAPIFVDRYRIPECDVFQTIYFPDPNIGIYRATLTGNLLTIESTSFVSDTEFVMVEDAFGLEYKDAAEPLEANHRQSFGKIAPVHDGQRKALLHRLTQEFGIYSLGRFATWRNILLDDVYEDVAAIRRMMAQSHYDITLARTK